MVDPCVVGYGTACIQDFAGGYNEKGGLSMPSAVPVASGGASAEQGEYG